MTGRFSLTRRRSKVNTRVEGMPTWLPPHLLCGLDDQAELGDLFVVSEQVALDRGGEAALRRQAQLLQRHEAAGVLDPPLGQVLSSSSPRLVVTRPTTTSLPLGTKRSG